MSRTTRERTYRAANAVGRGVLRALAVDVRLHGAEHLPSTGPVVLASTHGSYLDFVMLGYAGAQRGRFLRFLTRHDVWNRRLLARAMDGMGHVPVDRAAPAAAYLRARSLLERGEAVALFPEAGLSRSFEVRDLTVGSAALAHATGAPLLAVAMWGAQRITTAGDPGSRTSLRRGRIVDVALTAPLALGHDPAATTRLLGARLHQLLGELQALPHHQPRPGESAPWHPARLGGTAPTLERDRELSDLPRHTIAWRQG